MKKKLLSLILSISLVLGLLPVTAAGITFPGNPVGPQATDQVQYEVTGSGSRQYGTFEKAWNAIAQSSKGGTVKLIRSVTASDGSFGQGLGFTGGGILVPAGKTVELDLNGYAIDRGLQASRENGGVLTVRGILTVKDSRTGGTITGGNTTANGGGVTVAATGQFYLQGGTITGNAAQQGGGIYNLGQTFLSGGSVTKNTGGGVHQGKTLTVSGTAVITENPTTAEGGVANIYLPAGKTFIAKDLKAGAQIGITSEGVPDAGGSLTVATGPIPEYDLSKFVSDAGYQTAIESGKLVFKGTVQASHLPGQTGTAAQQPVQAPAQTEAPATGDTEQKAVCTVRFQPEGGVLRTNEELRRTVPVNTVIGALPVPDREGYLFDGWFITGSEIPVVPEERITSSFLVYEDMTLYAHWTAEECKVTFALNGGKEPRPEAITVAYGRSYGDCVSGVFPEDPEREGYTFKGWYTAASNGRKVTEETIVKNTANHVLYAQWEAERYTVLLDEDYDEPGAQIYEHPVAYNSTYGTIAPLRTPSRLGYEFSGWYTEDGKRVSDSTKVTETEEHTLYAHWKLKEVPVTFDRNYENAPAAVTVRIPYGATYGEGFSSGRLPEPSRKGYEFLGWYTRTTGGEEVTADTVMEREDAHTLYALWQGVGERRITFDPNGGSGEAVLLMTDATGMLTLPTPQSCNFEAPENKEFDRWAIGSLNGRKLKDGVSWSFEEDTTVYAIWSDLPSPETVTFDPNGGTLSGRNTKTVSLGGTYGTLPQPVFEGYTFAGWYTEINGGTRITNASTVTIQGDHTLYAHWNASEDAEEGVVSLMEEDGEPVEETDSAAQTATDQAQYIPVDGEPVTGTFQAMWQQAVQARTGTVKLLQNVTADASYSFGSGYGFGDGAVIVPEAHTLTLDLNGKTLNRKNPENLTDGYVIQNYGSLTIVDTSSDGKGVITGGHSSATTGEDGVMRRGLGGGIYNYGTLTLSGGTITGNLAESGGGVYNDDAYGMGDLHVSGNPKISGNQPSDVLVPVIEIDSALGGDAWIGVYAVSDPADGTVVAVGAQPGDENRFFSDLAGYLVVPKEDDATTLVLKSAAVHTVTFNPMGGTVSPETKAFTTGGAYGTLPTPVREGYGFSGWYDAETGGTRVTERTIASTDADHTLYAYWTEVSEPGPEQTMIVTFDPNGGTLGVSTRTYAVGQTYGEPDGTLPVPAREGYTFAGWFPEPAGGEQITIETVVENPENHTVYAHWTGEAPVQYTVTYNANGGSGSMSPSTVQAGKAFTMRGCGFTAPSGKVFDRWAIGSADSSETVLAGGSYTFTGDTTVYALWRTQTSSSSSSSSPGAYHPTWRPSASSSDDDDEEEDEKDNETSTSTSTSTTSTATATATEYVPIKASAGSGGTISPIGEVRVNRGSEQSFTITADEGYEISDVLIDGSSIGVVFRYTFEKVQREHTIQAVFAPASTSGTQQATSAGTTASGGSAVNYLVCPKDLTCPIASYDDIQPSGWYHDGVHYCIDNGLMGGVDETHFDPTAPLTRGMLAQILYNYEGRPAVSGEGSGFTDVVSGAWYEDAVKRAAESGLVAGYENGSYGPGDPITREQIVVVLWRHAGSPASGISVPLSDFHQTREYADEAMRWAFGRGIISGKDSGLLDPSGQASRAEVAQMLKSYLDSMI